MNLTRVETSQMPIHNRKDNTGQYIYTMEYRVQWEGTIYHYMQQMDKSHKHSWAKEVKNQRVHIVWFYLYLTQRGKTNPCYLKSE